MISRLGMLAPLVAVLVGADRKLTIDGRGEMASPAGPQMNCSRLGDRHPGIRLTLIRRAGYSSSSSGAEAALRFVKVQEFMQFRPLRRPPDMSPIACD